MQTRLALRLSLFLGLGGCGYPGVFVLADANGGSDMTQVPETAVDAGTDADAMEVDTSLGDGVDPHPCSDTQSDPYNCGSCGAECQTGAADAGGPACVAGTCSFGCATGFESSSGRCDLVPPRPIAPLGFSTVTSPFPVFSWQLPTGVTGAQIEISRSADFTSPMTMSIPGATQGSFSTALAAGRWFYRLHGIDARGTVGHAGGVARWFIVQTGAGQMPTARRSTFGQDCDFNNDGLADVVASTAGSVGVGAGATVWSPTSAPLHFLGWSAAIGLGAPGTSLGCAGDVDGDGYGDLIVGAPQSLSTGAALIYHGSASGLADRQNPSGVVTNPTGGSGQLGVSVAGAGDVDGDGYADVIVGAAAPAGSPAVVGAAYLLFGSATGVSFSSMVTLPLPPGTGNFQFGASVAGVGDVDGDGLWDVAVTQPQTRYGSVWIYSGQSNRALFATAQPFHSVVGFLNARSLAEYSGVGTAVGTAGDFDGDGLADVLVGSSGMGGEMRFATFADATSMAGAVTPSGLPVTFTAAGTAVSVLGDVDGDGLSESMMGGGGNGIVYLVRPGRTPATYQFTGSATFGAAVSSGDVNGDGRRDLIVGVPGALNPVVGSGEVVVHLLVGTPVPGATITVSPMEGIVGPSGTSNFGGVVAWGDRSLGGPFAWGRARGPRDFGADALQSGG